MKPPDSDDDASLDDLDEIVRGVAHAPSLVSTSRPEVLSRRLGTVLRGKYYLNSLLGVGGMAAVYKATHRNQAEYAIKMLLPEHSANEELRARFVREGYAANSVKHPGAVHVVDDDVAEDGTAFLVLELLHGLAVDELCTSCGGRLPLEAACAIGLQALDVLHAAHVNGIIHRDIKPANLFVLRDGSVKVLDFGIARVRETLAVGGYTTGSGVFLGTPAFMAPEQALGKASEVDARADIWAMGATLFSMMSGVTVHEGDSGRALLVRLVTRPTRSLLAVMPEVPKALAEVVDGALAADRDGRWASAADMRDRLEQASRQLWGDLPSRRVLASLVEANAPSSTLDAQTNAIQKEKPSPVMVPSTPTLRAQEHSYPPEIASRRSVETARPVARERDLTGPRRRLSSFAILALLSSVAGLVAIAAVFLLGRRDGPVPQTSPQAPGAPTDISTAAPPAVAPVPASPGVVSPADVAATDAASTTEPVAAPRAAGKPLHPRGSPRQDGRSSSAAPAAAHSTSPAVVAPSAQPTPSVQSTQPVQPAAPAAAERPASAPNCNPPYYYDAHFNRVFKKECL